MSIETVTPLLPYLITFIIGASIGSLLILFTKYRIKVNSRNAKTQIENLKNHDTSLSEERYQALFQHANDGVFILDLNGKHIMVNRRAAGMLGYTIDELIGKRIKDMVAPQEYPESLKRFEAIMSEEILPVYERTFRKKDGSFLSTEINATLVRDQQGQPKNIQSIVRDITERKKAEICLVESEKRYRNLVEDMPALICRFQPDGTLIFVNQAYCEAFEKTLKELLGFNFFEFIPAQDAQNVRAHLASLTPVAPLQTYEHRVISPTGEFRWQQWTNRAFFDKDGEIREYQSIGLDISHRKETEQQLRQAQQTADAANRAKSIFLANMSHELRTPLNSILGYNELLAQETDITNQQAEIIQIINHSGEHLLALVNDILDFSKIEAGGVELQNDVFDLPALLTTLEEIFRLPIEEKFLHLNFILADDLPQTILADRLKLRQILINLLSNAIKFTKEGGITLTVQSQPQADSPEKDAVQLQFAIQDTGVGIPPKDIETIFYPFVQSSFESNTNGGVGLGLTISREYTRIMGGDLTVESTEGKGSVFRFTILTKTYIVAESTPSAQHHPRTQFIKLAANQPAYKLLIVDDIEASRNLLFRILQPLGGELRKANNGLQAIQIFKIWKPDLVFMDIRMPEMNGLQAIRELKKQPENQAIKFVALTANTFQEERTKIYQVGYDGFIPKPFRRQDIIQALEIHLGIKFEYCDKPSAKNKNAAAAFPALNTMTSSQKSLLRRTSESVVRAIIHDLKNPLSIIVGCADMLATDREHLSSETAAKITQEILDSSLRLDSMLNAIAESTES